ncbi:MAG: hypothetical protein M3Q15_03805 [Pseudomonadota bacterium]|nr:hypothetical protein [Pseudomonadota bacterium]
MPLMLTLIAALGITALTPAADMRDPQRDQEKAFRATKQGQFVPLRVIEQRIVPRMRGADYLGPELNGDEYRLKFMRGGQVIWIDVDARSGRIVGKSGF